MSRDDEWFHGALSREEAQKVLYEGKNFVQAELC